MTSRQQTPPSEAEGPELFFALAYPVGVSSQTMTEALSEALIEVGYTPVPLHLIEYLKMKAVEDNLYERYTERMNVGNQLRADLNRLAARKDAFALLAASAILRHRSQATGSSNMLGVVNPRHAYIIQSLKRPEEVQTLRAIYGDGLIVVAGYAPPSVRLTSLADAIALSDVAGGSGDTAKSRAQQLIERDEREGTDEAGQRIRETFPLADLFVDASRPERLKESVRRFIRLLFGYQFIAPARDEYLMFVAQGTAYRSEDLSRQVGAVIGTQQGDVVAVGHNEVPKAFGGLYDDEDEPDGRDHAYGDDTSTMFKRRALGQILERLRTSGWLTRSKGARSGITPELISEASDIIEGTDLMNVGEFGRAVHAEMSALMDAARRGVPVKECTLYSTTFPCHVCARHIVAAGISRVVYIEPYPKSLVEQLHKDSIALDGANSDPARVPFTQFVGVAPQLFMRLFNMPNKVWRKTESGKVAPWYSHQALPRFFGDPIIYTSQEAKAVSVLDGLGPDYFQEAS